MYFEILCHIGSRTRFTRAAVIVLMVFAAPFVERPDILVGLKGRLIAVRLGDGNLGFSDPTRNRFAKEK